jgi:sugar-specific transcriptional regulator TrmB
MVDRTLIISLEGFARDLFNQESRPDPTAKPTSAPTSTEQTNLRELDMRIERIELRLRSLISSVLNEDTNRLPSHVIQKLEERLTSELRKNVAVDVKKYDLMHHRLEFCDLRELAVVNEVQFKLGPKRFVGDTVTCPDGRLGGC